MSDLLAIARRDLLEPAELDESALTRVLGGLLTPSIDYADLFLQYSRSESWMLEDGIVRDGSFAIDRGVGIRAVAGERTGFACSDDLAPAALTQAAVAARQIARSSGEGTGRVTLAGAAPVPLYGDADPLASIPDDDKTALLQRVDRLARSLDPAVCRVTASLSAAHDVVLVIASDGTLAADVRPLVRFNVSVIAERGGRRERGSAGGGGRFDYVDLLDPERDPNVDAWVRQAVHSALLNLEAVEAPAGAMPVVLGPGWPGVLLHEAVGHGLEGDFNRKGTSTFAGRVGERVASPLCTVVDQGDLPGRRGSLTVDDEGTPTGRTVLIENGILRGYMQDRLNARLSGAAPTGNGRRESYAHLPMPRMTNTFMLAGESDPEEILASVDRGLFAANFGGGQVDITSGKFVFSTTEAWLVEKGRLTTPVRGATLIGNGPEVMQRVSMVGNDLALDQGVGVCGKDGQSVPVGVGQPTLRVDAVTVGGTAR
ncbi:MAG: metalloprotease TldD [Pseudomonadales bacterium]|jgi:TldD protein|nr:metalloprotease TldD [Pseudomonadales bacterium]